MNKYERKLLWCAFVGYIVAPGVSHSSPWNYANEPLWLGTAVKHNLMFAIDDSGSMDWETSFDIRDGTPYINNSGNFVETNGDLASSGAQYAYVFPNGEATPYNGKRLYTNRYAIPPISAYASARSSQYNKAYYDPNVEYLPWPTFTDYTDDNFIDADLTATKFEPVGVFGSETINLFADLDTSTKADYWEFDIRDSDMVCEEDGSTCSKGRKDYTYYPATFYMKDVTSDYYYHAALNPFTATNSEIVEAESGTLIGDMQNAAALLIATTGTENDKISDARDSSVSSGGDFIGSLESVAASYTAAPTTDTATYTVTVPDSGTTYIWVRNLGVSSSTDSVWARLSDGASTVTVTASNAVRAPDANGYVEIRNNMSSDGNWRWTQWAEVALTAGTYTFELAVREGGTLIDQILFTTSSSTPLDIVEYATATASAIQRNCATDTSVAQYLEFTRNPERFKTGASASDARIDGFGFDGACLKKYEIKGADSDAFDNGVAITRTVIQEKQNFANWFQYHRKRHMAMRGALASSVQGINGINAGMFWINRRRNIDATDMNDMDTSAGIENFVREHFQGVPLYHQTRQAGTPLRSALDHALDQFTDTSGPVTSECQKNYTLLFTDGFNTQTSFSGVDNEDENAGAPYEDAYSGTMGDIAYKGYSENLRADLETGKVRVSTACDEASPDAWLDCNTNLHMNTYTVGLGVSGDIFGVTHDSVVDAYSATPAWPDVSNEGLSQIDDLYHAAVNGRGEMFSADSSDELATAMDQALDDIVATIGSGSGVTFNSSSLQANDGTSIYTTLFNSADWSGNLTARALDGQTGAVLSSVWKDSNGDDAGAAELLDERDLSANDRLILTMGSSDGVAFEWANLQDFQKEDLMYPATVATATAADETLGQRRLEYVRGDMTIAGLRDRGSRLGDIIHSAPVYVGKPASPWPDSAPFGYEGTNANSFTDRNRYSDFRNRDKTDGGAADRFPVVYVGANDGMLHGFNGSNNATDGGEEVLAYIPSDVYSEQSGRGLHYLSDPNYSHTYYVDSSPVVQDVYTYANATQLSAGVTTARDWRTLLVGGLRGGGKGIFTLDVTHPDDFSVANAANTVFWEFNEDNAPDAATHLGYRTDPPSIVMMPNEQWAVVFGNGLGSSSGEAVLFIIFIEEGLDGTWTLDDDYMMIETNVGTPGDPNGLMGVAVADTNGDFVADRIYAGDIKGNMWAFDVSNSTAVKNNGTYNWGVEDGAPLFTARDAAGNAQAITSAPSLAYNDDGDRVNDAPNILVTFGTGQYLEKTDISDTSEQSYYTVWDTGTKNMTRYSLTERSLTESNGVMSLSGVIDVNTGDEVVPWTMNGWFFDFTPNGNANGERLINKPLLAADKDIGPVAIFASMIPDSSECSGGGSSVLYTIPLLTGLNPTKPIADLNGDGTIDANDLGVGMKKADLINDPNRLGQYLYGSKGDSSGVDVTETTIASGSDREGRLGWFELIDE